ncbi:MAG: winged helix-turn-helix domain-containing protein [Lachnospiraceae bacterium]|nr:winged helix-turn-helix domain-containing protein [Lachnospiraceae bacterium]
MSLNIERTTIQNQIIQSRTKYCEPILKLLFQEGELYHGDLADKLNISPSGLNAVIKKMQETDPPIIIINEIGKYKIYTLPDYMKEYFRGGQHSEEIIDSSNLFLNFQIFVESAGQDWKIKMNLLLQHEDDDISEETINAFNRLIVFLKRAYENWDSDWKKVVKFLNNDVIEFLVKEYKE